MCLVSTVGFLPVSIVPKVEKRPDLSVGDWVLCLVCWFSAGTAASAFELHDGGRNSSLVVRWLCCLA